MKSDISLVVQKSGPKLLDTSASIARRNEPVNSVRLKHICYQSPRRLNSSHVRNSLPDEESFFRQKATLLRQIAATSATAPLCWRNRMGQGIFLSNLLTPPPVDKNNNSKYRNDNETYGCDPKLSMVSKNNILKQNTVCIVSLFCPTPRPMEQYGTTGLERDQHAGPI